MDFITEDELVSYLRLDAEAASADSDLLELFVELANGLVSDYLGSPTSMDPIPTRIRTITLEVAARAFRNPEGYASEQIDDYKYTRPSSARAAGIYLTDEEEDWLRGTLGTPKVKVGWLA